MNRVSGHGQQDVKGSLVPEMGGKQENSLSGGQSKVENVSSGPFDSVKHLFA